MRFLARRDGDKEVLDAYKNARRAIVYAIVDAPENIKKTAPKKEGGKEGTSGEVKYATSEKYDYGKIFAEQLNDWIQGKIPTRDSLIVGKTPYILIKIGLNALPVTINLKHVEYALKGTKDADHYLKGLLYQLPQKLANPVAVIQSASTPGRLVVLCDMVVNNHQVVVPISVDGYAHTNNVRIDSNAVTSIYGKGNALNLLWQAINDEAAGKIGVFYINTKKATTLLRGAGLQLPGGLFRGNDFVHNIREKGANVNMKYENVTETQQFKRWFGDWKNDPESASKVVNDDGTPKIVYHGTRANFNVFELQDEAQFGRSLGDGFYFTENRDRAFRYANGVTGKDHGGKVLKFDLFR